MGMVAQQTVYVRLLRIGEVFIDEEGTFEVTRTPEVRPDGTVKIYVMPIPKPDPFARSRAYVYDKDARVELA